MLKNAPTLAIGGVDTEENEHCKVLPALRVQIPQVYSGTALARLGDEAEMGDYERVGMTISL